jgi:hypothetical protein
MKRQVNKAHRVIYVVEACYDEDTVMINAFTTEKAANTEIKRLESIQHEKSTAIYLVETVTLWYV